MFYRNAQRQSKQRNGSLKFLSHLFFAILILQTQEMSMLVIHCKDVLTF